MILIDKNNNKAHIFFSTNMYRCNEQTTKKRKSLDISSWIEKIEESFQRAR